MLNASALVADVRLPKIFGNNMVLQRDQPIEIWGWADPGETLEVIFVDEERHLIAEGDGHWYCTLKARPAGGPYQLAIKGKKSTHA